MKTNDELIEWLRDAYAMEKAMELALKKQIETKNVSALMRDQAALHLAETRHHAEAVGDCLKQLGSDTSTLKTAMARGLEIMKGASTAFSGDHRVKDLLGICAAEHFEIACYTALRAGAARFGIFEIVETCNRILKEEQRMADWLEANLPHVVMGYLEEAGGAAIPSDAEDDDMPECASWTAMEAHPIQARPFEDITEGREIIPGSNPHAEALGSPPAAHVDDEHAEFVLTPALQDGNVNLQQRTGQALQHH